MHRPRSLSILIVLFMLTGCASGPSVVPPDPVDDLATMMTGIFDSAEQAAADPDNFMPIRLAMVPIWPHRRDGRWLYVEQAAASALERPYRQRIYHLHTTDGETFTSDVYTINDDPLQYAGAYQAPQSLVTLTPEDLTLRDGCSIILERTAADTYTGSTTGEGCASTLRGAAYATSEVTITPTELISWDRGWTAAGDQAWGAMKSGYIFKKRTGHDILLYGRCDDCPPRPPKFSPPGPRRPITEPRERAARSGGRTARSGERVTEHR